MIRYVVIDLTTNKAVRWGSCSPVDIALQVQSSSEITIQRTDSAIDPSALTYDPATKILS